MKTGFLLFTLLMASLMIIGFSTATDPFITDGGLKKFSSVQEIKDYLKKNQVNQSLVNYRPGVSDTAMSTAKSAVPQVASQLSPVSGQSTGSSQTTATYSTTNIQVSGVDEADIVKNDGKYIYIVSGDKIVTVDAYPGKNASIISKLNTSGTPYDIFVNGDRLVLFKDSYDTYSTISVGSNSGIMAKIIAPGYPSQVNVQAVIYNISDRKKPVLMSNISVDGTYYDSRRIGDIVYMVTQEYIYTYLDSGITVPSIRTGNKTIATPDVYYFDNPESQYVFHTITSFNMTTGKEIDSKTFLMGSTNTFYVSPDNMYLGYEQYPQYQWPMVIMEDIKPPVLSETNVSIIDANTSTGSTNKTQKTPVTIVNNKIPSTTVTLSSEESTKTIIHRLAIENGTVKYGAKGEVEGQLLNQFSLDEYNSTLRLATTVNQYSSDSYNNVVVLNSSMKKIGEITHVAPGEKIYSARFIGDNLYLVTFKQMDPFFVIDLSNPAKPKVLGKLKIPGFSDYLHPYDATHIIGIGESTQQTSEGGYRANGLKLALFDVTNATDPKMLINTRLASQVVHHQHWTTIRLSCLIKRRTFLQSLFMKLQVQVTVIIIIRKQPGVGYTSSRLRLKKGLIYLEKFRLTQIKIQLNPVIA